MSGALGLLAALLASAPLAAAPSYEVEAADTAQDALMSGAAKAWRQASVIRWGPKSHETAFRALWNRDGLFVRFDASDPAPWFTKQQRDLDLWREEVVEIFLDADLTGADYIEVEINPGNVVCDVHVDLAARRFDDAWNLAGLLSRASEQRDAQGRVSGWSAVAFLPWSGLSAARAGAEQITVRAGDRWRFNVFRIERPHGPADPQRDALLLAWSPTGKPSFHVSEAFRELVFR